MEKYIGYLNLTAFSRVLIYDIIHDIDDYVLVSYNGTDIEKCVLQYGDNDDVVFDYGGVQYNINEFMRVDV